MAGDLQNRDIEKLVDAAGGHVIYDGTKLDAGDVITTIDMQNVNFSAIPFTKIFPLVGLVCLNLPGADLGNIHLERISQCPDLVDLDLSYSTAADASTGYLKNLKGLRILNLSGCSVSDECIDDLLAIHTLSDLDLRDTHITSAGLARLKKNPKLKIEWYETSSGEVQLLCGQIARYQIGIDREASTRNESGKKWCYKIHIKEYSEYDESLVDSLNKLAEDGDLEIKIESGLFLSMLSKLNRIYDLILMPEAFSGYIEGFPCNELSGVQCEKLYMFSEVCEFQFLEELSQMHGLAEFQLVGQGVDRTAWDGLISVPNLKRLVFDHCYFYEIQAYAVPTESLSVVVYGNPGADVEGAEIEVARLDAELDRLHIILKEVGDDNF